MTELQAQPQGNMPGIQLYGSRCNPYTFPITRIPRPLFLDNLHSRQNNTFTRERFQAWASGNRLIDNTPINNKHASSNIMSVDNTASSTASLAKSGRPFVAAAAFPDDIPRLVEVEFAAFQDEIVNHVLSYRDPTNPEHTARTIDFYKHCMQHIRTSTLPEHLFSRTHMRTDSKLDLALANNNDQGDKTIEGYRFRKVIDPKTDEIIAFCKTEITTLTPEDHASPLDIGHETEPQMNRDWFALNERLHRQYCGLRQHLYFGMLATHPSHQHRGAATSLMSELIAEADALGLEIYCEATKTGRPMYEKYGFVPVYTLSFDPAEYGVTGLGVEVQTVMVRGALGEDGIRREVRRLEEVE